MPVVDGWVFEDSDLNVSRYGKTHNVPLLIGFNSFEGSSLLPLFYTKEQNKNDFSWGVDGLVTIEDLIEQVLGEIEDEHDIDEVDLWKLEKPGTYIVQAKAPLEEFEAEIGRRLSDDEMDDEIDTLGGLIFSYVKSYGCQMNVYDSEKISSFLTKEGMVENNDIYSFGLKLNHNISNKNKA